MSKTYRELSLWKRIGDKQAVNFRCFEEIESHLFYIQSADFYTLPLRADAGASFDHQFVELFIELEPIDRSDWFGTVEEAIAAHEETFRSMAEGIAAREKKI